MNLFRKSLQEICAKHEHNINLRQPDLHLYNKNMSFRVDLIVEARKRKISLETLFRNCEKYFSQVPVRYEYESDVGKGMCFLLRERFPKYYHICSEKLNTELPDIQF